MANIKITDLTAYADPASTDVLPIVDVGADVTKKVSIADLLENAGSGTESAPGIAFDGDSNTGIYRPGADQVAISTNGAQKIVVDANGNVGIGGNGTGTNLGVYLQKGGGASAHFYEASDGTKKMIAGADSGQDYVKIGALSNHPVGLITNNGEKIRITTDGKLGLGTSSPGWPLSVYGSSNPGIGLRTSGGTSDDWAIRVDDTNNRFYLFNNTSGYGEVVSILRDGRLLVGSASASSTATTLLLQGSPDGSSGPSYLRLATGTATPGATSTIGQISFTDSGHLTAASIVALRDGGTWTSGSSQPTSLTFTTTADGAASPTERMRIGNTGRTHIYNSAAYTLNVRTGAAAGAGDYVFWASSAVTDNMTGGSTVFAVYTNGNVQNTNNSYTGISDIKLKENIVDAKPQWDDIKGLRVVNYNLKPETGAETFKQLGLIAQEVELVSPGLVSESPDRDAEGNDLGTVTKSVNYSVLYMKAVKALQEAMERIETLETEVAALKAA